MINTYKKSCLSKHSLIQLLFQFIIKQSPETLKENINGFKNKIKVEQMRNRER